MASHPPEHRDPPSPSAAPGASSRSAPAVPGLWQQSPRCGARLTGIVARRGRSRREGNKSKLHQCWHGRPSQRAISGRARPAAGISTCRCCLERLAGLLPPGLRGRDTASAGTRRQDGVGVPPPSSPAARGSLGGAGCPDPVLGPRWGSPALCPVPHTPYSSGTAAWGDTRCPAGGQDVVASQGDWQGQGKRNLAVAMVTT